MKLIKFIKNHTIVFYVLKKLKNYLVKVRPQCIRIAKEPSYYPEEKRKSLNKRIRDNLKWYRKHKEINEFYNLYGLDLVSNKNCSNYIPYNKFFTKRSEMNKRTLRNSQIVLLNDKYLFYKYMKMYNLPVPEVFAFIVYNKLVDNNMQPISEDSLKSKNVFFMKYTSGSCGDSVKKIKSYEEFSEYRKQMENTTCILQDAVIQHEKMNELNPNAVNTIRIITVNKNGETYLFGALIRIGTKNTGEKDNTSQGGIAVGVKEDGKLMDYGIRKPEFGGILYSHPDTNVVFKDFEIPFYKEAVETCLKAHKYFYNIRSIGWDVAITPNGPVFIEGNDDWEIQTIQAIKHGCWDELKIAFDK